MTLTRGARHAYGAFKCINRTDVFIFLYVPMLYGLYGFLFVFDIKRVFFMFLVLNAMIFIFI